MKNINELKNKIGYQIFPLTFKDANGDGIGDLKGIEQKLPYLKKLGIDIIWLCPIYRSNFTDAGYDVIDYCQIEPRFGSMKDFDSLMEKAKKLKMDIMMDFVVNHASTDSYEFKQACLSRDNKYHDFFMWEDKPDLNNESIFGSSAWEYVESVNRYYLHIFTKEQADFNFHSKNFKKWLYKILEFWIKKGVKYFRFDAIEHIGKTTNPYVIRYGKYNHQFLKEISDNVAKKYDAYIIGESWNVKPSIMKKYCLEDQIVDSFFNFSNLFFDWKNENGAFAKKKNKVNWLDLKGYFEWQIENLLTSPSWTNHDVPRAIDRYFKTNSSNRFYAQTAMMMLLMTTKGIPFIYQGEEFGMAYMDVKAIKDFRDPQVLTREAEFVNNHGYSKKEYLKAVCEGSRDLSRSIMAWDNTANSGFAKEGVKPFYNKSLKWKTINAKKDMDKKEKSIFEFTRNLISLRKSKQGEIFCDFDSLELIKIHSKYVIYKVMKNKKNLYISINWSEKEIKLKRNLGKIIMSNYNNKLSNKILKPFEATIYEGV